MKKRGDDFFEGFYVDDNGIVAIECCLCDSIHIDTENHLRIDHQGNPVAARILAELERMKEA